MNNAFHHDDDCQLTDQQPCTCAPITAHRKLMPWHGCLITFVVRNAGFAQDINLRPELPKTWALVSSERKGLNYYKLEFEVEGLVNIQDGETVQKIIEELGM